jgi:hypothetical protein
MDLLFLAEMSLMLLQCALGALEFQNWELGILLTVKRLSLTCSVFVYQLLQFIHTMICQFGWWWRLPH